MDLKQFAARLRLSPTTVSRVLSGRAAEHRISAETQARVHAAAAKIPLSINHQARSLRLQSTRAIGLIVPDISNPWFAAFAQQVEKAVRARGYSVLLADSREEESLEIESISLMRNHRVDGFIIAPVRGQGEHLVRMARERNRFVLVDRAAPDEGVSSVVLDNAGAAQAAVQLLADAGHRRIGCIRGRPESYVDRERVRGFRAGLRKLSASDTAALIAGEDYGVESGRAATRNLFAQARPPTALVALSNLLALGALEALDELGRRIPDDVSIVSFDEQPWAAHLSPPLTTIAQPVRELGDLATQLLFEQIEARRRTIVPRRVVLPYSIKERGSIGPVRRK